MENIRPPSRAGSGIPQHVPDDAEQGYLDALEYFEDVGMVELFSNLDAWLGNQRDVTPEEQLHQEQLQQEPQCGQVQLERLLSPPDGAAAERLPSGRHQSAGPASPPEGPAAGDTTGDAADAYDQFDIGEVDLHLFRRMWGPKHIKLRDKLAFLVGSTLLWGSAYWLGNSPGSFWQLYTLGAVTLLGARVVLYRRKKWHYYLLDFCYYANVLLLLHLWVLPRSKVLHKVTFGYNSGPLAWSILAFRNSLVYHDLDKVTSLYLHMMPFAVSWAMRWHRDTSRFGPATEDPAWEAAGLRNLVLLPLSFYCLWSGAYYIKVFWLSAATIEKRGYVTLFTYVTSQKRGTFHSIASKIPRRLQPVVYLGMHLTFCCTTLLLAAACWYSFVLHTALLIGIFSQAIWHGANYYFEVFAQRYAQQVSAALKAEEDGTMAPTGRARRSSVASGVEPCDAVAGKKAA